jgi:hypothetical protein
LLQADDTGSNSAKSGLGLLAAEYVGLLALALPAIGYASAYRYKLGQALEMGIPPEFVSLTLRDAVVGCLGVAVALAVLTVVENGVQDFLEISLPKDVGREIARVAVPVFGTLLVVLMSREFAGYWFWVFLTLSVFAVLQLGLPLLTQRHVKGYAAKLKAQRKVTSSSDLTPLSRFLSTRRSWVVGLSIVYLVLFISSPAGAWSARVRTTFGTISGQPTRVIVGEYEQLLLTLELDRDAKSAGQPLLLLRPEDVSTGVTFEKLGMLSYERPE